MTADAAGNIYLGLGFGATIDMDPGAGVASFTSPGFSSSIIAKYDANGNYLWGFMLASPSSSGVSDIRTDAANNVFFTGSFHGTVDFDPGTGTHNLVSNGNSDIFFAKYDANGNFLLAKNIGAGAFDNGSHIEIDATGSILVSGYYRFTVDFDPGPGVANLIAAGTLNDIFFAKYDAAGNYLWARSLGSTSNDIPGGITIDASGNVIVTGGFTGTVDFDPGSGNAHITSQGQDVFIAKYDQNGNYTWAKRIGSSSSDAAYAITGDGNGGFYITGDFSSTADFDPDGGVVNITPNGSADVFIARYTSAGAYVSAGKLGGPTSDHAQDIALVDVDNVVATGYFQGTADFDPGTGVSNLTSAGIFDIYFAQYTSITGPLPVTLSSLTTQCRGKDIEIRWTSAQEHNTKHFVVERSFDGNYFESVATIAAAGFSNVPLQYSFVDNTNTPGKKTFYRLKQTDLDGKFTHSKVITAGCVAKEQDVYLFPNPAMRDVNVELGNVNDKIRSITIFDISGRKIRVIRMDLPSSKTMINIRSLQAGVYRVLVETQHKQSFEKLVIKAN